MLTGVTISPRTKVVNKTEFVCDTEGKKTKTFLFFPPYKCALD